MGISGVPRNFVRERGGVQKIQVRTEDREKGDLGAVAQQSGVLDAAVIWHNKFYFILKNFLISGTLRLFMITTNLFVIANVKQLRTGGSFRILLLFSEYLGVLES